MSQRRRLPNRRRVECCEISVDGVRYIATVSRFDDGQLAELFLDGGGKVGSAANIAAQDAAILASLLLQHGVGPNRILRTLTKLHDGATAGPVGRALASFGGLAP